jgi:hypothetical protein
MSPAQDIVLFLERDWVGGRVGRVGPSRNVTICSEVPVLLPCTCTTQSDLTRAFQAETALATPLRPVTG